MKAAKIKRPPLAIGRFKFSDGTVFEVDAVKVLRRLSARALPEHQVQAWEYEDAADRIEALHRRAIAKQGGDATRDGADFTHKDLDDVIRGCLARGDETGDYVKSWAKVYEVSIATVYRRIRRLKPK